MPTTRFRVRFLLASLCALVALAVSNASAEVTCLLATNKSMKGKLVPQLSMVKRATKCKKGEVPALSGPAGEDGQLRVYGDGSAGPLTVNTSGGNLFTNYAADRNTQFSSITIGEAGVLTVPGGTILRATGDVFIAGSISVGVQNFGGTLYTTAGSIPGALGGGPGFRVPGAGISSAPASGGEFGSNLAVRVGGVGGFRAVGLVNTLGSHLLLGGGGGGPGSPLCTGGLGGGALMIIAKGTITIASGASIDADGGVSFDGSCGAGGGGGGVVVLASKTAIDKQGFIHANGGEGRSGGSKAAAGGGGGGGLVMLVAPTVSDSGLTGVVGGAGGNSVAIGTISETNRIGGGGGGASAGDGGYGADALVNGSCYLGGHGGEGKAINIETDPTALF